MEISGELYHKRSFVQKVKIYHAQKGPMNFLVIIIATFLYFILILQESLNLKSIGQFKNAYFYDNCSSLQRDVPTFSEE